MCQRVETYRYSTHFLIVENDTKPLGRFNLLLARNCHMFNKKDNSALTRFVGQ